MAGCCNFLIIRMLMYSVLIIPVSPNGSYNPAIATGRIKIIGYQYSVYYTGDPEKYSEYDTEYE